MRTVLLSEVKPGQVVGMLDLAWYKVHSVNATDPRSAGPEVELELIVEKLDGTIGGVRSPDQVVEIIDHPSRLPDRWVGSC